MKSLPSVTLPSGVQVPKLGQGTWMMGEDSVRHSEEIKALQIGIDLGLTLIDTAEMYAEGGAEEIVGQAIQGRRDNVFVVSKVYPHNAGAGSALAACERSLKRLKIETIDLYLLHWRGSIPLAETVEAFERLIKEGKIKHWGVSNFDTSDMQALYQLPDGKNVQTNQVLYNLKNRELEWSLHDLCRRHQLPLMAYCPLGQGDLAQHKTLKEIANRHNAKASQIALAWLLGKDDIISIPKAVQPRHLEENRQALDIRLSEEDLELLETAFPPPRRAVSLETV
ncbi:MAG: aldo/keto reductase [Vampirovibrionales bacterium]|nr:aldo/keto reductase [Vampirovibrionales bacterium]